MLAALRRRRKRAERRNGLIALASLLIISVLYAFWHERHEGPRHLNYARTALHNAGFPNATIKRSWTVGCGRGSYGYLWETARAEGRVCSYSRPAVRVVKTW